MSAEGTKVFIDSVKKGHFWNAEHQEEMKSGVTASELGIGQNPQPTSYSKLEEALGFPW